MSKIVSHALRHEPWVYGLELDDEGWVSVAQLLDSLRLVREEWRSLSQFDLEEMVRTSSKQRHEIRNGRIRALYAHSVSAKVKRNLLCPPRILFHGTSPKKVSQIKVDGLRPMNRHYVHLSTDEAVAFETGKRKARRPIVLRVRAMEAFEDGVPFYEGNQQVWLADAVPPQYIDF